MIHLSSVDRPLPYFSPLQLWTGVFLISFLALGSAATLVYIRQFEKTFYPGVTIDTLPMAGLTSDQAHQLLLKNQPQLEPTFTLTVDDITISSTSAELKIEKNIDQSIQIGFLYAKTGTPWRRLYQILKLRVEPLNFVSGWTADQTALHNLTTELKQRVDTPNRVPAATLRVSQNPSTVTIDPGLQGREVDLATTLTLITPSSPMLQTNWQVPVSSTGSQLSSDQVTTAKLRAAALVNKTIAFRHQDLVLRLNDQDLVAFLAFPTGLAQTKIEDQLSQWQKIVDRPPQDAEFDYDSTTLKVAAFKPHQDGLALDRQKTQAQLEQILTQLETTPTPTSLTTSEEKLSVSTTPPAKTLATTNQLGINELVGFGDSEYDHSIPNRIHNVALTGDRIDLTIIKPGEEFSFNKALGDVSGATGYKQAYVIKNGQTILGDGGGVCQVSTTLFRAVLNAGLPITKRKAHSYRVSYYELNSKPGIDATVYSGEVDLRFINDTSHHLLIKAETNSQTLEMKVTLYGTSDGRTTEIVDHKTWDARSAPPSVYITDPSLPRGTRRQIDFAASGIRASFTNVVKDHQGSVLRRDTYTSNYIPWSAKYLVGP